jgi:hypothetical protein
MTLDDIIESFREYADDLAAPYLWSDCVVEIYADQAEKEACERRPLLTSSTDTDMCQIAVTSGTDLYTKHAAVREVYYAKFTETTSGDEHKLRITNIDELTFTDPDWEDLETDPCYLILDDTTVQIVPSPTVDGTLEMSISYVPKIVMSTKGSPTIHDAHHYNLVYWMLHLGFEKRDADTFNANKALDYSNRFANYFGDPKGVNALKSVRTVRDDRSRGGWI